MRSDGKHCVATLRDGRLQGCPLPDIRGPDDSGPLFPSRSAQLVSEHECGPVRIHDNRGVHCRDERG